MDLEFDWSAYEHVSISYKLDHTPAHTPKNQRGKGGKRGGKGKRMMNRMAEKWVNLPRVELGDNVHVAGVSKVTWLGGERRAHQRVLVALVSAGTHTCSDA